MHQTDWQRFFDHPYVTDYQALCDRIDRLAKQFPTVRTTTLGKSILGRDIHLLTLGTGTRKCLYVATHHAMEWITSWLLLRFTKDLCLSAQRGTCLCGVSPAHVLQTHTLYILPMLNPDGVEYQIHGVDPANPLHERLLRMNGNSTDFSHWQANARGVDLNHNYNAGFSEYKQLEANMGIADGAPTRYSGEAPESEPETAALCDFIRFTMPLDGMITLHTQGEEIYYESGTRSHPRAVRIARSLARSSGYKLSRATDAAAYGGLTDWSLQVLGVPSFTVECGCGKNPLPIEHATSIYCRLRQALFLFPVLL